MGMPEIAQLFLHENDVLGLQFSVGSGGPRRIFYFKVIVPEGPIILSDFSLGAASAQATAGTGWQEVDDASSRFYLEPSYEEQIYHFYWGISPSYARVYTRYPGSQDRLNLITTRNIGDPIGYIDGRMSPIRAPSKLTESFSLKGTRPTYNGYHPYGDPSSITVYLNFYIYRYHVDYIKSPSSEELSRAIVRTPGGGSPLIEVPSWVRDRAGS